MKIEVSNGEIIDKLTILLIKLKKISCPQKLANIKNEIKEIYSISESILTKDSDLFQELLSINSELWAIEDSIRNKERLKEFDEQFIELARLVYKTNDRRAELKKIINKSSQSKLFEEKSYDKY